MPNMFDNMMKSTDYYVLELLTSINSSSSYSQFDSQFDNRGDNGAWAWATGGTPVRSGPPVTGVPREVGKTRS